MAMTNERIAELLRGGEGLAVEYKLCSGRVEHDVFETICAFLNRFGGDLLLGVDDKANVVGIKGDTIAIRNNIVNCLNDVHVFEPVAYVDPRIVEHEGRTIVHVRVAASAEVHRYKGVVYDRNGDADIRVRATRDIADMILRKQNVFTERRIYPYVSKSDLRLDLLKRMRIRAQNLYTQGERHPWSDMDDDALLRSAGLVGRDRETGREGFNLAAVALLGRDEVIGDVFPVFGTDAICRIHNVDRYDDRDIVRTNLIESYDRLMAFARKHLPDPFFLEGDTRKSIRDVIVREMIGNTLIHREFTSARPAQFVIEKDRVFVENACRAARADRITPENFLPDPKNPIIAAFFREVGYADQLGSGVKNLYRYAKEYGGADPEIIEGDLFRISVSLATSKNAEVAPVALEVAPVLGKVAQAGAEVAQVEAESENTEVSQKTEILSRMLKGKVRGDALRNATMVLTELIRDGNVSVAGLEKNLGLSNGSVKNALRLLRLNGIVRHEGKTSSGSWVVLI